MAVKKVLVINGPNLNMLSIREPGIYGNQTLDEINNNISTYAKGLDIACDFFQSNCEGEIINAIHSVLKDYDGCIINAGAYTHYSYAIYDAINPAGTKVSVSALEIKELPSDSIRTRPRVR